MRALLVQVLRGFAMGCADLVPGVSGATVALVLGIYERLIASIESLVEAFAPLLEGRLRQFGRRLLAVPWEFLLPLGAGIFTAIVLLSRAMSRLLDEYPHETAGFFFGLVAASAFIAWGRLRDRGSRNLALAVGTGVAAYVILGWRSGALGDPPLWFVALAGAAAITAMVLPGISGSFVLLMLGMYEYVLDAVNERDLVVLAVFAAGVAAGLVSVVHLLSWLLRRFHDPVLAAMVGLLLGSLRVLWPWPDGVDGAALSTPPWSELPATCALAVLGAVTVVGLARASARAPAPRAARGRGRA